MAKKKAIVEERHLSRPQVFIEETKIAKIYDLLVQGLSVRKIAEQLGVTEEAISTQITKERMRMSVFRQDMLERYDDVTLARTEYILSRLLPIMDAQINNDPMNGPSRDLMKQILDFMKFGREIAAPAKNSSDNESKVTINQTFVAGSPMYDEALQSVQTDFLGYTVHAVDEPTIIVQNERLAELEDLATAYFPEGLALNDGLTDDD